MSLEIKVNIREHFHKLGKIFKINSKFPLPQIIVNESLVLSYYEFTLLLETSLLDKIINGLTCEHIRFYTNKIAFASALENNISFYETSLCVYCYSLKKKKQQITVICNYREYTDEENDEIFSFCEKNNLTMRIYDYENNFISPLSGENFYAGEIFKEILKKKEKCLIIDDEVIPYEKFYEAVEKKILNKNSSSSFNCSKCGVKLESSLGIKKCFECLMTGGRIETTSNRASLSKGNESISFCVMGVGEKGVNNAYGNNNNNNSKRIVNKSSKLIYFYLCYYF